MYFIFLLEVAFLRCTTAGATDATGTAGSQPSPVVVCDVVLTDGARPLELQPRIHTFLVKLVPVERERKITNLKHLMQGDFFPFSREKRKVWESLDL